ncbi:MAG TPA: hypothetical protein VJA21_25110 [Verrucomicrobiae bacterium]
MKSLKIQIGVAVGLGAFALLCFVFLHLALSDIYHGEADLTLEWRVVQVASLGILVFIVAAMFALGRALKFIR